MVVDNFLTQRESDPSPWVLVIVVQPLEHLEDSVDLDHGVENDENGTTTKPASYRGQQYVGDEILVYLQALPDLNRRQTDLLAPLAGCDCQDSNRQETAHTRRCRVAVRMGPAGFEPALTRL